MRGMIESPCRADAERAAKALVSAGVSRVVLFGSVARGDATDLSDIDLVAIYDDLDYEDRRAMKQRLSALARATVGHTVDVLVTDWPEWKVRTEQVLTSLESRVAREGVVLADRGVGVVDWDKEMVLPTSDYGEAVRRLREVSNAITMLGHDLGPGDREKAERERGDPDEALYMFVVRMENACGQAQRVVESAVKSLVHLGGRERYLRGHDINELCHALVAPHSSEIRKLMDEGTAGEITRWHELSRYEPDEPQPERDMTDLLRRLAGVACSVASYTVAQFDEEDPNVCRIRRAAADIESRLTGYDLESGSPPDTPGKGDNAG